MTPGQPTHPFPPCRPLCAPVSPNVSLNSCPTLLNPGPALITDHKTQRKILEDPKALSLNRNDQAGHPHQASPGDSSPILESSCCHSEHLHRTRQLSTVGLLCAAQGPCEHHSRDFGGCLAHNGRVMQYSMRNGQLSSGTTREVRVGVGYHRQEQSRGGLWARYSRDVHPELQLTEIIYDKCEGSQQMGPPSWWNRHASCPVPYVPLA
jgi:hypothetical protein